MDEITELERRIAAALERIGQGAELLARRPGRDAAGAEAELGGLEDRLDRALAQVEAQAAEIRALKAANEELGETLRGLREAGEAVDPALIDRARTAELEAMRAARRAEVIEIEGLLAELRPLIGEAHHA